MLVFLGLMGVGLNRAFERSVVNTAEDALRNQVLLLISAIDVVDGKVEPPQVLSEPRLYQPDSDLFAQIYAHNDPVSPTAKTDDSVQPKTSEPKVIWRSPSLLDQTLPSNGGGLGDFEFYQSIIWQDKSVNTTILAVEWETENGLVPFVVQVAESDEVYQRRLSRYQRQVGIWLVFFGGALIVLLLVILGWSLKPLERVRRQVSEIEEGRRQRFDEDYPMEVSRLTQNLNQLLSYEELRIERHKEVLGNLAHSLKTPIAVLSGLEYSPKLRSEAGAQLSAMQTIIDYQLQSASAVGRRRFSKAVDVEPSSQQVVRSLGKIHLEKGLDVRFNYQAGTVFFGDLGDWMEVLGNLCDNAFKWSSTVVDVTVRQIELGANQSHKKPIEIIVQDDGPGIDEQSRESVLGRGVRLDSQTPGHGLGMDIVKGIVDAYNGSINIEAADESLISNASKGDGTKFTVQLN